MSASPQDGLFQAAVAQHGPAIQRLARTYEAHPSRREELLQDIWLALWQALGRFRQEASLRTFVFRVAHNVAIKHVRRDAKGREDVELPETLRADDPEPAERLDREQRRQHLLHAVRALPDPDRQLAMLHLEGLSNAEVAEVSGLSPSNVGTRLHRIRGRLRQALQELEHG